MTARFAHDPDLFAHFPMLRVGLLQVAGLDRIAAG